MPGREAALRTVEILLIEDSPADARLFELALVNSDLHHRLHTCADAAEAITFLRREGEHAGAPRPDLIFLDLNMPGKSGRELLADLKLDEDLKAIPVIILTSSAAAEDISDCYRHYANCFVTKPLQLDDFMSTVRSTLQFWQEIAQLPT